MLAIFVLMMIVMGTIVSLTWNFSDSTWCLDQDTEDSCDFFRCVWDNTTDTCGGE